MFHLEKVSHSSRKRTQYDGARYSCTNPGRAEAILELERNDSDLVRSRILMLATAHLPRVSLSRRARAKQRRPGPHTKHGFRALRDCNRSVAGATGTSEG